MKLQSFKSSDGTDGGGTHWVIIESLGTITAGHTAGAPAIRICPSCNVVCLRGAVVGRVSFTRQSVNAYVNGREKKRQLLDGSGTGRTSHRGNGAE